MNPMMAAAMMGRGGEISRSLKYILLALALALAAFMAWRTYSRWRRERDTMSRNSLDPGVTPQQLREHQSGGAKLSSSQLEQYYKANGKMLATRLRNAFNPSGIPWLILTDTTNNKEVISIAKKIKELKIPFSYIAQAYYDGYKDDLNDRLRSELSVAELRNFYIQSGLQPKGLSALGNPEMASI